MRGYDERDWIVYETGEAITGPDIDQRCREILENETVAYAHILC